MKKITLFLLLFSLAAFAGEGHKKSNWVEELGLTEAQAKEMKSIKKANHEKMMAYKKELAAERDAQFAQVLNADQMAKLKEMRKKQKQREKHMAKKAYKKHKKHKKDKAE